MRKVQESELLEKFMSSVYPEPNTGCWLWGGLSTADGYGVFKPKIIKDILKTPTAHRVSYLFFKGDFEKSLCVLHSCDNPACVNPDHLWLGTQIENIRDRTVKGRSARQGPRGERAPMSVLKKHQIPEILSLKGKVRQLEIAKQFGVSQSTIHHVLSGKTWK